MNTKHMSYTRIGFGLLGLSAIITEIVVLAATSSFNPVNFFSFFTVLSNMAAAGFLIYYGLTRSESKNTAILRGAVTLYMVMTGIIFALLLAGLENVKLTATPWDNIVLHYIMPVALALDWLVNPPKRAVPIRAVAAWIVFPIAYVVYTLIRGSIVDWYPYPFLNPSHTSYERVLATSLIIAVFVLLLAFAIQYYSVLKSQKPKTNSNQKLR